MAAARQRGEAVNGEEVLRRGLEVVDDCDHVVDGEHGGVLPLDRASLDALSRGVRGRSHRRQRP